MGCLCTTKVQLTYVPSKISTELVKRSLSDWITQYNKSERKKKMLFPLNTQTRGLHRGFGPYSALMQHYTFGDSSGKGEICKLPAKNLCFSHRRYKIGEWQSHSLL